jgi:hypothetical protein
MPTVLAGALGSKVLTMAKEQTTALGRLQDDSLVVRCDVTMLSIKRESRVNPFLCQFLKVWVNI